MNPLRFVPLLPILLLTPSFAFAADKTNVLIILVDDLGYGDLACFGAADMRTPHLDRLAAEGQRWTNFYANCPVCSPTRAALLTGRYQDLVGVPGVIRTHARNSWGDLADHATLLPEVLRNVGYRTSCIGKWHLGIDSPDTPLDRGFEVYRGFLGDMMDDYETHRRHGINYMRDGRGEVDPKGHATDLFTDWSIEELRAAANDDRPFFQYLAYNAPHTPIQPPEDWLARVKERRPDLDEGRARLVALIEHLDDGIGRVLSELERLKLLENTVVVFTSDNGGQITGGVRANNGATRAGKGTVYEGGIRVPAIVRWPGVIQAGTEPRTAALSMDIFPTVCEIAGVDLPDEIDGVSFLPTLRQGNQPPLHLVMFFRRREGGAVYNGQTVNAVRAGPWKLVQNSPWAPTELYRLDVDPLEENDLSKKAPKVRKALLAALAHHRQRCGAVPWQPRELVDEPITVDLP